MSGCWRFQRTRLTSPDAGLHVRSAHPSHLQAGRSRSDRGVPDARPRQEARASRKGARAGEVAVHRRARADDAGRRRVLRARAARPGPASITSSRSASPLSARERRARSGMSAYFAELIDEWAPEAHADERLYRLGSSVDRTRLRGGCAGRARWRGTSSTGSCGCRASIRRSAALPGLRRAVCDGGARDAAARRTCSCAGRARRRAGRRCRCRGAAVPASGGRDGAGAADGRCR